jgi:hypothetical protein
MMPAVSDMPSTARPGPSIAARMAHRPAACALVLAACLLSGCGTPPPAPPPPPPHQSAWTPAQSEDAAKQLAAGALAQPWLVAFRTKANRAPGVTMGSIQDKTGDEVDVALLAKDLAGDLAASGQLSLVDPAVASQADFQLSGSISMDGIQGGARYTIDMHLTGKDGDTVWVGGLERDITAPAAGSASAAPPAAPQTPP